MGKGLWKKKSLAPKKIEIRAKLSYNLKDMATTSNILTLLKFYSSKQKRPTVDFDEFDSYIKRYAQHHLAENADLADYVDSKSDRLRQELDKLVEEKQIAISHTNNGKEYIFVLSFLIQYCASRYEEIQRNLSIPFPNATDLPKHVPNEVVTRKQAIDVIYQRLEKEELNDRTLWALVLSDKVPPILFPSNVKVTFLIECAINKLHDMLGKEEVHDYYLKKLTISNPGKELSIKNFFTKFCSKPMDTLEALKQTGEGFYYWNQFFHFIKQDFNKTKDLTLEDTNILQSVAIVELAISFYKTASTHRIQKETAFRNLDMLLQQPPYYYTYADITKFKDPNGIDLLGQYSEESLKGYLKNKIQHTAGNDLPDMLTFTLDEGEDYFILKEKVMPLMIRLCHDARATVRSSLTSVWQTYLVNFEQLPEMKDDNAFERCLQREVKASDPVLYALLNTAFLPVLSYEDQTPGKLTLYRNNQLIPYSELLMVGRQEILSDAKIKLPFWYSMPIVIWFMSLLLHKPKSKTKKVKKTASEKVHAMQVEEERLKDEEIERNDHSDPKLSRKKELRKAAGVAEKVFVPESSTLSRELISYCHEWNNRIGKENYDNLTEDVNSLVRDYMRKVLRTLKAESFNADRIQSLAQSLVETPSLLKIQNHEALKRYVELYIVKLVKNIP